MWQACTQQRQDLFLFHTAMQYFVIHTNLLSTKKHVLQKIKDWKSNHNSVYESGWLCSSAIFFCSIFSVSLFWKWWSLEVLHNMKAYCFRSRCWALPSIARWRSLYYQWLCIVLLLSFMIQPCVAEPESKLTTRVVDVRVIHWNSGPSDRSV